MPLTRSSTAPAAALHRWSMSATGTTAAPPTTTPGGVITIIGGPNATAQIPGSHQDPGDFFGSALVLVAIVVAIGLARLVFRRPGRPEPPAEAER